MAKHLIVRELQHGDPQLWIALGPALCSRDVLRELGGPIYSEPNTIWFIAYRADKVVGFCAIRSSRSAYWYDYAYVFPSERKRGVFARLAEVRDAALKKMGGHSVRSLVRESRWPEYKRRGWRLLSCRGMWRSIIREGT